MHQMKTHARSPPTKPSTLLLGEMRGEKADANVVPSKGIYENWNYGWLYPVLLGKDAEGWVRFANYVRIPPDCDGFKVFQSSRKNHPPAEFRDFKVVRLD